MYFTACSLVFIPSIEFPHKLHGKTFLDEVVKCLDCIENISDIDVPYDKNKLNINLLSSNPEYLSLPDRASFKIYIPKKLHKKLIGSTLIWEKFSVVFYKTKTFPITIIVPDGEVPFPKECFSLVQKYLERNFSSNILNLKCFPPFPVDCYLTIGKEDDKEYLMSAFKVELFRRGEFNKDIIQITFSPKIEDPLELFLSTSAFLNEVGLYFYIQHKKQDIHKKWVDISIAKTLLVIQYNANGRVRKFVDEVIESLAEYEIENAFVRSNIINFYEDFYGTGTVRPIHSFKYLIEEQKDRLIDYPVESVRSLVNHIESRRTNRANVFATILGALMGAILTLIIQQGM